MSKDIWMYLSFIRTSDLIIKLLEIYHIHSSCISYQNDTKTEKRENWIDMSYRSV